MYSYMRGGRVHLTHLLKINMAPPDDLGTSAFACPSFAIWGTSSSPLSTSTASWLLTWSHLPQLVASSPAFRAPTAWEDPLARGYQDTLYRLCFSRFLWSAEHLFYHRGSGLLLGLWTGHLAEHIGKLYLQRKPSKWEIKQTIEIWVGYGNKWKHKTKTIEKWQLNVNM